MTNSRYDSEFCGSLPIHLINLIQPYGVLLAVDIKSKRIVQASENANEIFGMPVGELVNTPLAEHIAAEDFSRLTERMMNASGSDSLPASWRIGNKNYPVVTHLRDHLLLIEMDLDPFEEEKQHSFLSVYQEIKFAMSLIQSANTIDDVARVTARELKRISGFDKVMVYRFDKEWNGTVIAEEKEEQMESYDGFTFPASDIPHPARVLYLKNPYRFIPTREHNAVKLFPVINPLTNSFLDLSDCNVRAVSAVHLEYLKNMNVMASMSTRILVANQLWGLIACHHQQEKKLTFEMRAVFEMISDIVSARVATIHSDELRNLDSKLRESYKDLVEAAYRHGDLHGVLLDGTPDLLDIFNAQGVAISRRGKMFSRGTVPDEESLSEFILWLHTRHLKGIFYTDSIRQQYDKGASFQDKSSGVLAIPINSQEDEYLLVFRAEVVRIINWGGDPAERIVFEANSKNYHPRASFQQWRERVEGTSVPWREEELSIAENLRSFIFEFNNKIRSGQ